MFLCFFASCPRQSHNWKFSGNLLGRVFLARSNDALHFDFMLTRRHKECWICMAEVEPNRRDSEIGIENQCYGRRPCHWRGPQCYATCTTKFKKSQLLLILFSDLRQHKQIRMPRRKKSQTAFRQILQSVLLSIQQSIRFCRACLKATSIVGYIF